MDNPYIQPKKTGVVLYIIVGVFVVGLIIAGAAFAIMQPFKIPFITKRASSEGFYTLSLSAYADQTIDVAPVSFELLKDNAVYAKGSFADGVQEKISGLSNMSNYSLKAYGSGFYPERTRCFLADSDSECHLTLSRKGESFINVARLNEYYHSGALWVRGGVLRNGTVCVGWKNLMSVSLSLSQTDIPSWLSSEHDRCWLLPSNLTGIYHFDINISQLSGFYPDRQYHLTLADLCEEDCQEPKRVSVYY